MAVEDSVTFALPGISFYPLSGDFHIPHLPDSKHPRQLGLMAMYAATHGALEFPADGDQGADPDAIHLSSPMPWNEEIVARVTAIMHDEVAMIGRLTISAPKQADLDIGIEPFAVTVDGTRYELREGGLADAQVAITDAAKVFFNGATNPV